jgi:predicted RNase H-like nuclease (RuvC/YqgF family)
MESKQQLAAEITDSNNTIIKISDIALKHVANLTQELEETKDIAVREYETATELYTSHLESLQQENQDLKNTIREYESRMTKMRNGFRLQLATLKDEARLYMDSIKGVMDMFF